MRTLTGPHVRGTEEADGICNLLKRFLEHGWVNRSIFYVKRRMNHMTMLADKQTHRQVEFTSILEGPGIVNDSWPPRSNTGTRPGIDDGGHKSANTTISLNRI